MFEAKAKILPEVITVRGYKLREKEYVKATYCHPAYLTYMQNTS